MKVLVTGASGFLGSHVARRLVEEGHDVRVLLRPTSDRSKLRGLGLEEATGDISDLDSLHEAIQGIDVVVHSAALVSARSLDEFRAVNAGGTKNVIDAIDRVSPDARLIYISSLAASGPSQDGLPKPDDAQPTPVSHYGQTKLAGEDHVVQWRGAAQSMIIRPPVIYGPGDLKLLPLFRMIRWRLAPMLGAGLNRMSVVYIDDAVDSIVSAIGASDTNGAYHIADGRTYTWQEIFRAVEGAVGTRAIRLRAPMWAYMGAAFATETWGALRGQSVPFSRQKVVEMSQTDWLCDHVGIERAIGWKPSVELEEGARRTAAWYRSQGLL